MFCSRGMCLSFTSRNWLIWYRKRFKYCCMRSSLASLSPLTCPTTSWESLCIFNLVAPSIWASFSPVSRASYSASLLVIVYCSHTARSMMSPSGNSSIMPILLAFFVDNPSMWVVHFDVYLSSSFGSSSFVVNSAMKSASAWTLIAVRGR